MNAGSDNPFAPTLPRQGARALPWMSVVAGSALTALPVVATVPLLPPFGLLMLLAWRLLVPFALRRWAAAPLGFADDLMSGQPLGSAVLLWSLCFLMIDIAEQRMPFRDFWQDWLVAAGLIALTVIGGRYLALSWHGSDLGGVMLAQILASVLLFPLAMRLVAWMDVKRAYS